MNRAGAEGALRIAVVAGEASGDRLGAGLIRSLRSGPLEVEVAGVAGPAMRKAGCRPILDASEFAVMGLVEIVRHLPRLWRLRRRLVRELDRFRPHVFVGVDSPELNLSLAGRLRRRGVLTVQYVCPSIWAWRAGRVRRIRRACSRVLCLLPFEPELLREAGADAVFVGHPLADEQPPPDTGGPASVREGNLLVALLPGSRSSEIARIGPPLARAAAWLAERRLGVRFSTLAASDSGREQFAAILRRFAPGVEVRQESGSALNLLRRADLAAAASGTVTMEAMISGCPLVVAYRVAPPTAWIARMLGLLKTPYVALPNILAGRELVPELLQGQARGETLGAELLRLYDDPGARQTMRAEFVRLSESLGRGVNERAAQAVLALARAD